MIEQISTPEGTHAEGGDQQLAMSVLEVVDVDAALSR
jgi:hypothetical protein